MILEILSGDSVKPFTISRSWCTLQRHVSLVGASPTGVDTRMPRRHSPVLLGDRQCCPKTSESGYPG